LKDGVNPVLIENAAKNAGMPVGPLAVTDEVAIDLAVKIAEQGIKDGVYKATDTSYVVGSLMSTELGRHGKKNKKGFYDYPENEPKKLWDGLAEHFPVSETQPTEEEIQKRILYRQSIETIRCLDEGVLNNKLDGNIGSILGWGFPPYLGGTLNFPEFIGAETFLSEADRLTETYGERFKLTDEQKELVKSLYIDN
jgi:3-hydroxyacyl-CoA dehydrogenase/enoyl-CoA hydratase/3-hydroxybutyryl-CoA epimerase